MTVVELLYLPISCSCVFKLYHPESCNKQVFKCFFSDSDAIKKMYSASVTERVCWALDRWVASGGDNKVCSCCETSCSERRQKRGLAADAGTVYTSNTTSHLGMNLQHWILTRGETFHTSYVIEKLPKISQKKVVFFLRPCDWFETIWAVLKEQAAPNHIEN